MNKMIKMLLIALMAATSTTAFAHHHHHHRSSLRAFLSPIRDITRIFGSFFQRIHYLVKSAFLYR